ncbi:thiamine phosphate synthase [Rhodoferax sp.]|uniref:thiamine phosphate synthase n=1 Tax=Rhodoferax sp. TaxID=50421 RepID=UPI0025E79590|nr:thiamine phosphate synthase [Rhodoferax sp.]
MITHNLMVNAIIAAHPGLALTADTTQPEVFHSDAPVYRAAKQACLALGFIEPDAECLANAWQAMTERTGHFNASAWPDDPADFGMRPWPRQDAFAACPHKLGLYAVLPDAAWVARMARAGVPTVQLRFKSDDTRAIEREVSAAVQAVQGTDALLFINDHWQAAIAAGAYGVHLGQEDLELADLQAIRAAGLRLGLSSHGYAEMLRADRFSPSYLAMGAVFPTTLKRMVTAPQGTGRLSAYARLMRDCPLVAIGGIDHSTLPDVLVSGVGSVAVVRALVAAEQPEAMAASLQAAINAAV